jgi:hypothetical protein
MKNSQSNCPYQDSYTNYKRRIMIGEKWERFLDRRACVCMVVNLSEILDSTEMFRKKKDGKIGEKWLGKFEGAIPSNKKSTEYLKELRGTLHGKI